MGGASLPRTGPRSDRITRTEDEHMRHVGWRSLALTMVLAVVTGPAMAAPTDPHACEAALEKAAGKLGSCLLKAEASYAKGADAAKRSAALAKCHGVFGRQRDAAIARYGAADCPAAPAGSFSGRLDRCRAETVTAAHGGVLPTCGDGAVNVAGEECDGADLAGATCESLGRAGGTLGCTPGCRLDVTACGTGALPATGQTTCWSDSINGVVVACAGTQQDGAFRAGATPSYQDDGDGTVTDRNTGLTWEKLDDAGGLHDKDATYTWADAFAHVAALNAAAFGGHSDWRLPNVRELRSITDFGAAPLSMPAAFDTGCTPGCTADMCSCTRRMDHWTSTTYAPNAAYAWAVSTDDGESDVSNKTNPLAVRAVRGNR